MQKINIIGAGLAGSEAAYFLANKGYDVHIFEVKNVKKNSVQKTDFFAELVCSNSLRSNELSNAVGTLKQEMRLLNSLVIQAADFASIPAGGSLAVDREKFSEFITNKIKKHNLITIHEEEKININTDEFTIIATGPLTTDRFQKEIWNLIGNDNFYFYDAVAPIIKKESIDMSIAFRKNRYEKGETQDYINCPMNKNEYDLFYNELINAEISIGHLEEEKELKYFEGCMPIEAIAKRGEKTMVFGPLKPQGLKNIDGTKNYAVVQLRQDNAKDDLYNIVGFQTNLKWPEQKRVFSLIPGLKNAEFVRYGVMHKNNFINSPKILDKGICLKTNKKIFFAGQITGVEGYVESSVSGIIAGINLDRKINNLDLLIPPPSTVTGSLLNYISNSSEKDFQPMKANWGIVSNLDRNDLRDKKLKKELYSIRAIKDITEFITKI